MPPAPTGSMLSHAAQAASFNQALHLTGKRPALRPSFASLSLMNTASPSGPAGELGRWVDIRKCAFMLLAFLCVLFGCTTYDISKPGPYQEKVELAADMSDGEILGKLGYNISLMKRKDYEGTDGVMSTYANRAGDKVVITRSAVTGTYIMESRYITNEAGLRPGEMYCQSERVA
jgi:hypothetical protein